MADENHKPVPTPTEVDNRLAEAELRRGWYARRPAKIGASDGLDHLHAKMVDFAEMYETGDLADQRYAVAASLIAIQDFLTAQGFSELLLAPSYRPIEALHDQEYNRLDPMFTERKGKKGGRPTTSIDQHHRLGVLAALAQYWLDSHSAGDKVDTQLAAAARRFRGAWFGQVSVAELKRARLAVSQEPADHPTVLTAKKFRAFIDRVVSDFGSANAINIVVRHLNTAPASTALGNWEQSKS